MIRHVLAFVALLVPVTAACAENEPSLADAVLVSEIEVAMGEFERNNPSARWIKYEEQQAWRAPFYDMQREAFAAFLEGQGVPLLRSSFSTVGWIGMGGIGPEGALYFAVRIDDFQNRTAQSGGTLSVCRIEMRPDRMPPGQILFHMLILETLLSDKDCTSDKLDDPRLVEWSTKEIAITPVRTLSELAYGVGAKVSFVEDERLSDRFDDVAASHHLLDEKPLRQLVTLERHSVLLQAQDGSYVLGHSEQVPGAFGVPGWKDDSGACLMRTDSWADLLSESVSIDSPSLFGTSIDNSEVLKAFCDEWQKDHSDRLKKVWDARTANFDASQLQMSNPVN